MIFLKKQAGITMLELALALALASGIIIMGIRFYTSFKDDQNVRQLKANVDRLFQATQLYYQANCANTGSSVYSATAIPISGTGSLTSYGFLDSTNWPPPYSPLISSAFGTNGYLVEFIQQLTTNSRTPSATYSYPDWGSSPYKLTFASAVGDIDSVLIHVAVLLNSNLNAAVYAGRLEASCTSTSSTAACSGATAGNYIIWERSPSFASPNSTSNDNISMPRVRAFNNLYRNDDMYRAYNPSNTNTYLCGG